MRRMKCVLYSSDSEYCKSSEVYFKEIPFLDITFLTGSYDNIFNMGIGSDPRVFILCGITNPDPVIKAIRELYRGAFILILSASVNLPTTIDAKIRSVDTERVGKEELVHQLGIIYEQFLEEGIMDVTGGARESLSQKFIFIRTKHKYEIVEKSQLIYVKGLKEYLMLYLDGRRLITLMNFDHLEKLLNDPRFLRVHRSYIVNIEKIDYIDKSTVSIGDNSIPLGLNYRDMFFGRLRALKLLA